MAEEVHILIADDDEAILETLSDILEARGYTVAVAKDGAQAVELVRQALFDLVLLDMVMPGMNGVQASREIKKISPQTEIIMMTGYAVPEQIEAAVREGALRALHKPFDLDELFQVIESMKSPEADVLVVDDDPVFCRMMKAALESRGYTTSVAYDGEQAIAMAERTNYDLLFIDMKLPSIDGLQTYLALRERNPGAVAIMISGYAEETGELMRRAIAESAALCLYKPLEMGEVLKMVEGYLGGR